MHESRVYRAKLTVRILAALVPGSLAVFLFLSLLQTGNPLAGVGVLLFAIGLIRPLVSRVEVDDRCIRDVGAFRTHELSFAEIAGYRLAPGRRGRQLVLESREDRSRSMRLTPHSELVAWAAQKFPNLTQEEASAEFQVALASESLGADECERVDAIEETRKWAVYLNAAAGLASAWVVFFPLPLRFALAMTVALPVVALAMVKTHRDALRLVGKDEGILPDVFLAFTIPIFALAVRVQLQWTVLAWDKFWLPFVAVAGAIFWISRLLTPQDERGHPFTLVFVTCSLLYAYGSVVSLNHIFDAGGLTDYKPLVMAKRVTGVRKPMHLVQLGPFGSQAEAMEIRVSPQIYEAYDLGDTVTIRLGQGALGIPYYEIE